MCSRRMSLRPRGRSAGGRKDEGMGGTPRGEGEGGEGAGVRRQLQAKVSHRLVSRGVNTADRWSAKPSGQMTREEQERLERQRANKRRWAQKERHRCRQEMETLRQTNGHLQSRNDRLRCEVDQLQKWKCKMRSRLLDHACVMPTATATATAPATATRVQLVVLQASHAPAPRKVKLTYGGKTKRVAPSQPERSRQKRRAGWPGGTGPRPALPTAPLDPCRACSHRERLARDATDVSAHPPNPLNIDAILQSASLASAGVTLQSPDSPGPGRAAASPDTDQPGVYRTLQAVPLSQLLGTGDGADQTLPSQQGDVTDLPESFLDMLDNEDDWWTDVCDVIFSDSPADTDGNWLQAADGRVSALGPAPRGDRGGVKAGLPPDGDGSVARLTDSSLSAVTALPEHGGPSAVFAGACGASHSQPAYRLSQSEGHGGGERAVVPRAVVPRARSQMGTAGSARTQPVPPEPGKADAGGRRRCWSQDDRVSHTASARDPLSQSWPGLPSTATRSLAASLVRSAGKASSSAPSPSPIIIDVQSAPPSTAAVRSATSLFASLPPLHLPAGTAVPVPHVPARALTSQLTSPPSPAAGAERTCLSPGPSEADRGRVPRGPPRRASSWQENRLLTPGSAKRRRLSFCGGTVWSDVTDTAGDASGSSLEHGALPCPAPGARPRAPLPTFLLLATDPSPDSPLTSASGAGSPLWGRGATDGEGGGGGGDRGEVRWVREVAIDEDTALYLLDDASPVTEGLSSPPLVHT